MVAGAQRLILLLGALAAALASPFAAAGADDAFSGQIGELRATAYLMPRTALQRLHALEAAAQPLTTAQQGQVLEVAIGAQFWLRDPDEGLRLVGRLERLAAQRHDNRLAVAALLNRAYIVSKKIHDAATARQLIVKANDLAAGTNDARTQVRALVSLGMSDAEDGDPAAGLARIEHALALARTADDRDTLILALKALAGAQADLGRFDAALGSADALVALTRHRGLPIQVVRAELTVNDIAARAGLAARARTALRAAVAILETLDAGECLPRVLVQLAEADSHAGDYAEAIRLSDRALRMARASGDADDVAHAEFEVGVSRVYLGQLASGRRMAEGALAHFRSSETYVPMMLSYGQALATAGAADAALKVYADAGAVGMALWKKDKESAREAVVKASAIQKKESENASLNRENASRQAELRSERKLKHMGWLLSIACAVGCAASAVLYRRVRASNQSLRALNDVLYMQSTSDTLTGLRNRNFFYAHVNGKSGADLAGVFCLIDVDHFKSINDTHGHAVGDAVLRAVAQRIAACARGGDLAIRWGGEEFLVFMPGMDIDGARQAAARLLDAVSAQPVDVEGGTVAVTVSLGFSVAPMTCDGAALTWEQHIHLADLALYRAKAHGRHRAYGVCGPQRWDAQALALALQDLGAASARQLVDLCLVAGTDRVRAADTQTTVLAD